MTLYIKMRNDFNKILSTIGQEVIRTPITKSISNSYGDETLIKGADEAIIVSINIQNMKWNREESGAFKDADVIMYTKYNQDMNINDIIKYNNNFYKIEKEPLNNTIDNQVIFKKCGLFLIEN